MYATAFYDRHWYSGLVHCKNEATHGGMSTIYLQMAIISCWYMFSLISIMWGINSPRVGYARLCGRGWNGVLCSHQSLAPGRCSVWCRSHHCRTDRTGPWASASPAERKTVSHGYVDVERERSTLNFTILQISMPTFCPAPSHAFSVSAAAFLT